MKKDKSGEVTPHNLWTCVSCDKGPLSHEEAMAHLKEAHGVTDTKKLKGTRKPIIHLDGDTWFSWQYAWEIETPTGKVNLAQDVLCRRAEDDMMRHC